LITTGHTMYQGLLFFASFVSLSYFALVATGAPVDCDCVDCTDAVCGAFGGGLTYCEVSNETSASADPDECCSSECYFYQMFTSRICTSIPLPPPRLCNCSVCTNETCGETWNGLTYCPLEEGNTPTPATCSSQCYFHTLEGTSGNCQNQLHGPPLPCANVTCRTNSCGTTTCDASTGQCSFVCEEGCCFSYDSNSCQPCTSGGNITNIYTTPRSSVTPACSFPPWAIAIVVIVILLLIVIIVIVVLKTRGGSTTIDYTQSTTTESLVQQDDYQKY